MKTVAELIKDYRPLAVLMNAVSMLVDEIGNKKETISENETYLAVAWNVFHQNVQGTGSEHTRIYVDAKKLAQWEKIDSLLRNESTNDHTKCPACGDQAIFCGCVLSLADEILQSIKKEDDAS